MTQAARQLWISSLRGAPVIVRLHPVRLRATRRTMDF